MVSTTGSISRAARLTLSNICLAAARDRLIPSRLLLGDATARPRGRRAMPARPRGETS
jgi:hypothetical protein